MGYRRYQDYILHILSFLVYYFHYFNVITNIDPLYINTVPVNYMYTTIQKSGINDTLNWSKVTVKTFEILQNIYI